MEKPLISVVVPVYNVEDYLRERVTAAAGGMTWLLCRALGGGLGPFLLKGLLGAAVPNAAYPLVYRQREELLFFKSAAAGFVGKYLQYEKGFTASVNPFARAAGHFCGSY